LGVEHGANNSTPYPIKNLLLQNLTKKSQTMFFKYCRGMEEEEEEEEHHGYIRFNEDVIQYFLPKS
jgi:hypothetical protein